MSIIFPEKIFIYKNTSCKVIRTGEIVLSLQEKVKNLKVEICGSIFNFLKKGESQEFAKRVAKCRITDVRKKLTKDSQDTFLYPAEIEYEIKRIRGRAEEVQGVLYDGFLMQELFEKIIPQNIRGFLNIHILLYDKLLATYSDDGRYHLRTVIFGIPSIISIPGIVEAPAKSKSFYALKNLSPSIISDWKKAHRDEFIDLTDARLQKVVLSYIMQIIFYHILGDPFCEDKSCCLFNAHYQKDLIFQILSGCRLCNLHQDILNKIV